MEKAIKLEDASRIAALLPALMRQLFTLDNDLSADLPLAQLRVCAILQESPCSMSVLSKELGVSLSAMTQIADRLERAKLVRRGLRAGDRRIRCLELTERGGKIIRRREQSRIRSVSAVLNYVSPDARTDIVTALETLMKASREYRVKSTLKEKNGSGPRQKRIELLTSKVSS